MRWVAGVFLFVGILWLWMPWEKGPPQTKGGAKSSRQVLDDQWRALSEKEMSIADMERFAAGLSDEELWAELEETYQDWSSENAGKKRFEQPRLAIFLGRELGKRDRELGLAEICEWLFSLEEESGGEEEKLSREEFQFVEMRIRISSFAGWVSVDADEAISRLVESRRNEEEIWSVVNQGFLMYIKFQEFFAMEEVLRDGFRQLAKSDFARAKELFEAGTGVWAFDPNEVVGSLLSEIPQESWSGFFESVFEEVGRKFGEKKVDGSLDSMAARLRKTDWTSGYLEILNQGEKDGWSRNDSLWALARDRPDEVKKAIKDDRVGEETKRWLVVGMVAADPNNVHLLNELADAQMVDAVHAITNLWSFDFKLLTGRDGHTGEGFDALISAIEKTPMGDEVRKKLNKIFKVQTE